jgi:hypothetical protein
MKTGEPRELQFRFAVPQVLDVLFENERGESGISYFESSSEIEVSLVQCRFKEIVCSVNGAVTCGNSLDNGAIGIRLNLTSCEWSACVSWDEHVAFGAAISSISPIFVIQNCTLTDCIHWGAYSAGRFVWGGTDVDVAGQIIDSSFVNSHHDYHRKSSVLFFQW